MKDFKIDTKNLSKEEIEKLIEDKKRLIKSKQTIRK